MTKHNDTLEIADIVLCAGIDDEPIAPRLVAMAIRLGGLSGRLGRGPGKPTTAKAGDVDVWIKRGCPIRRKP